MRKIIAFAGSSSKNSINKVLATYVAHKIEDVEVEVLDLNDFPLPIYSFDYEAENGIPDNANLFLGKVQSADGIILSLAEHNGAYSSVFKNIFDWMSRIDGKLWGDVPMLLMATSPGGRGGATVLEIAKGRFPYMGGNIVADLAFPSFGQNFVNQEVVNKELKTKIESAVEKLQSKLS